MPSQLQVFVSSACEELRDLRITVRDFLIDFGVAPLLSEDSGFPKSSGDNPNVACLKALEECPLVIGIIENRYGRTVADWGPYQQYAGLSPIHAEFLHAIETGKKLLLYVHHNTLAAHKQWRSDTKGYAALQLASGPDIETLQMFNELVNSTPAPFYEGYRHASDVVQSLKKNLVNEICSTLRDQARRNRDETAYLMEQILAAAPEVRKTVQERLNPDVIAELASLNKESEVIRAKLDEAMRSSGESEAALQEQKSSLERRIAQLQGQLKSAQISLTMAAVSDARWLHLVRTRLMPKQPSRVPFHNDAEVAIRGYHCSNVRGAPVLKQVTWSKLPYREGGLHRGYRAGLIFRGSSFAPGVTWAEQMPTGEYVGTSGNIWWRLPNIYFGDYLEVSTAEDPDEGPLSHRGMKYAVRNPKGEISDWIEFDYPFDLPKLAEMQERSMELGRSLVRSRKFKEAIEPLRKAMTFSEKLVGASTSETEQLRKEWDEAIDAAMLAELRFSIGTTVLIRSGPEAGRTGRIEALSLRQVHAYQTRLDDGRLVALADAEVEKP